MMFGISVQAQATDYYLGLPPIFDQGIDLFEKEMYAAAHQKMLDIVAQAGSQSNDLKIQAEYYTALSSDQLFNRDAVYHCLHFLKLHPEYPKIDQIYFAFLNRVFAEFGRHTNQAMCWLWGGISPQLAWPFPKQLARTSMNHWRVLETPRTILQE